MTDAPKPRYVVLTESETAHLVAIRRDGWQWMRVVGVFASKDRAESYAEIENMMLDDDTPESPAPYQDDLKALPPKGEEPKSGLTELPAILTKADRTPRLTRAEDKDTVVTLADEILAALPAMIEKFPYGPTPKDVSEWLSVEDYYARRAMNGLHQANRATLMRRKDSRSHHLVPIGYKPPRELLTSKQNDILQVIISATDSTGIARISRRDMAAQANTSVGGIDAILGALIAKGRIAEIQRGGGTIPSFLRVIDATPGKIMDLYKTTEAAE